MLTDLLIRLFTYCVGLVSGLALLGIVRGGVQSVLLVLSSGLLDLLLDRLRACLVPKRIV